jgi:hypothetical protein
LLLLNAFVLVAAGGVGEAPSCRHDREASTSTFEKDVIFGRVKAFLAGTTW